MGNSHNLTYEEYIDRIAAHPWSVIIYHDIEEPLVRNAERLRRTFRKGRVIERPRTLQEILDNLDDALILVQTTKLMELGKKDLDGTFDHPVYAVTYAEAMVLVRQAEGW